jgi:serine-type D-Ala-D-Ala endopeptidase (penicillin-binding protein 7)
MPPSRRNLIIIGCLCIATVYISLSVRVYTSTIGREKLVRDGVLSIPYAPYSVPASNFFTSRFKPAPQRPATTTSVTKTVIGQSDSQIVGDGVQVTSRAYIVADLESGKVYLEKNSRAVLPVASMSKLITAFVATELIDEDEPITISDENAALPPDSSGLRAGETLPMKTILYPLLLSSSNVAAEALASAVDRNDFLESMSSYAWEVGMPSSYFADASGLSPQNAASARDMFALAKYLHSSRQDILRITRVPTSGVGTTSEHGSHIFASTHPFVIDPRFLGGKTGRTPEAGETMITLMKINNRPLALIVLGSQYGYREADTRTLIEKVMQKM